MGVGFPMDSAARHGDEASCDSESNCSTLYYMTTLTIRLDKKLESDLRDFVARTGQRKSDFARDALKRQLAIARLEDIRRNLAPFAELRGWLTDDDVFAEIS